MTPTQTTERLAPDFDALRAERNRRHDERAAQMRSEGWTVAHVNPDACYCDCTGGGPCEHDRNGPEWTSEDGLGSSTTCARCGAVAMLHDMRVFP